MKIPFSLLILVTFHLANAQTGLSKIPLFSKSWSLSLNAMEFDDSGNLWMAYGPRKNFPSSNLIGLAMYDGTSWRNFNIANSNIPTNQLTSFSFQRELMWIGSTMGLIRKNGNSFTLFSQSPFNVYKDSINDVFVNDNDIWVATQGGLSRLSGTTWTTWDTSNSKIISNNIRTVFVDKANTVWLGTSQGLCVFKNNTFIEYNSQNSRLASNEIYTIDQDASNTVWIGTDTATKFGYLNAGLYYMDGNTIKHLTDRFPHCNKNEIPNRVFDLTTDAKGNLYAFAARCNSANCNYIGIYAANKENESIIHFKEFVSWPSNYYFNQTQFLAMSKGENLAININLQYADSLILIDTKSYKSIIPKKWSVSENLDINYVKSPFTSKGEIGWDMENQYHEVPKGSCKSTYFVNNLWMGAVHNNNIYVTAQTYRQIGNDLYGGPLKITDGKTDSLTSVAYDRVWKVNRYTIAQFIKHYKNGNVSNGFYQIPEEILTWPAHGDTSKGYSRYLAPFVDVDNNGTYNPYKGDYPKIKGDQALYIIVNDNTFIKSETQGLPFQVEMHGMAYAYFCDQIKDTDSNAILNNTTFYDFNIINRSNRTYQDFHLGMWSDVDLGYYNDDYIGCNPKHNYSFGYNASSMDIDPRDSRKQYGVAPPASAVILLNAKGSVTGNHTQMHKFLYYENNRNPINGNPDRPEHYYNYLKGIWKNNQPMMYGIDGVQGTDTTTHMFPWDNDLNGRPFWSEKSANRSPSDRRSLQSTNMGMFYPGETKNITYAITYSRVKDTVNWPNPIIQKLHIDVLKVKQWYQENNFPSCLDLTTGNYETDPLKSELNQHVSIYPNPAQHSLFIKSNDQVNWDYSIFDLTGRELLRGQTTSEILIESLKSGIYFLQLKSHETIINFKLVKEY